MAQDKSFAGQAWLSTFGMGNHSALARMTLRRASTGWRRRQIFIAAAKRAMLARRSQV